MDIKTTNRIDRAEFVENFEAIFEHSPWVAERAFHARPFGSIDELHAAMAREVEEASRDEQLALLRAHPDLAGKEAQAGTMTRSSVAEQASAALDRLTASEMKRIRELNAAYRDKHGFPFIIAVRHYTKDGILHEFERRLSNDTVTELAEGLSQIFAIARLRLRTLFAGGAPVGQSAESTSTPLTA